MALPFSQSMRSLQADRSISTMAGLVVATVILLLWAAWFFWAPITRYESGTLVGITREGRVVANFPARALAQIQQGQAAYIRPQSAAGDSTTQSASGARPGSGVAYPAIVANILTPVIDDHFQVSLSTQSDVRLLVPPGQVLGGEVVVEVERVSPAMLVARASGLFVDTPSLSLSPQQSP